MSDLISRQAAIDELSQRYIIMDNPHYIGYNAGLDEAQKVIKALPIVQPTITHEQAIDYLHETGWLQNHDRILTESKIVPPVQEYIKKLEELREIDKGIISTAVAKIKKLSEQLSEQQKPATVTIGRTRGETTMWYECDACGEPVNLNDNYCRNCGRKLIHD